MTDAPTTRADHAELVACPFCGGTAKAITPSSSAPYVLCCRCHAGGPVSSSASLAEAVSSWNRRASDQSTLLSEIATLRARHETTLAGECPCCVLTRAECADAIAEIEIGRTQAERQRDELREALQRMEWSCEQLAATRTVEVYDAMIQSGQTDALLELDNARRDARQVLANQGAE